MAVRTPAQLRSLETGLSEYTDTGTRGRILSLTGLYNDAITGSETDYGTYAAGDTVSGNIPSDNVSWGNVNSGDGKWSRSAELSFNRNGVYRFITVGRLSCRIHTMTGIPQLKRSPKCTFLT